MDEAKTPEYAKVLVVEDDADMLNLVVATLEKEGFHVFTSQDGGNVTDLVSREHPDLLVLDVMLPHVDGLTLARELRKTHLAPILMLSARGEDVDKILGLEVGADDYLAKPFNPRELTARVRALLRRDRALRKAVTGQDSDVIRVKNLRIYPDRHHVELNGQEVRLTPLEFSLLKALAQSPGRTLTRQDLLDRVWGQDFFGDERTVDAHVRAIRAKLQAVDPEGQYIVAVWRVGYRLDMG